MTKKEMLKAIARNVEGDPKRISDAMQVALDENNVDVIRNFYAFFRFHPEHAAFCLKRLCGYDFQNL